MVVIQRNRTDASCEVFHDPQIDPLVRSSGADWCACHGWLYASETQSTTITFVAPVHFLMLDGNDVQVPAGTYRIEQAGESQLRLLSESAPPIQIAATKIVHEERVSSPTAIAVMEEGQDDTLHLLLVLADGQGLDATGSFSGLRSRGTLSALQPVQVQSAVNQFKVIAPPAPAQPSPQQMLPAAAIVRVPQASVGSVDRANQSRHMDHLELSRNESSGGCRANFR